MTTIEISDNDYLTLKTTLTRAKAMSGLLWLAIEQDPTKELRADALESICGDLDRVDDILASKGGVN